MIPRLHNMTWALAAIPYLLVSSSQQAGMITWVDPDGAGERLAFARCAIGRAAEAERHLARLVPDAQWARTDTEASGERALVWRDSLLANIAAAGDIKVQHVGILQNPWTIFTHHTWQETLSFDRGDATDVEVHGQGLARLMYAVRMPGTIISHSPPGSVTENKVEWEVRAEPTPQTFTVQSRSVRWGYLLIWLYVVLFVVAKVVGYAPRVAKYLRRKPKKI